MMEHIKNLKLIRKVVQERAEWRAQNDPSSWEFKFTHNIPDDNLMIPPADPLGLGRQGTFTYPTPLTPEEAGLGRMHFDELKAKARGKGKKGDKNHTLTSDTGESDDPSKGKGGGKGKGRKGKGKGKGKNKTQPNVYDTANRLRIVPLATEHDPLPTPPIIQRNLPPDDADRFEIVSNGISHRRERFVFSTRD